jgi:hypothetical protein
VHPRPSPPGLADIAIIKAAGMRGIMHLEGVVGAGAALASLEIWGSAIADGAAQLLASSLATPASDFAGASVRKPANSPSPETTAANGSFWIDLLVDALADIHIFAAANGTTTLALTARVASRARTRG